MGIRSSCTSMPSRRSCRDIRSNCSKGPTSRPGKRRNLEPRRLDSRSDRLSAREGEETGRALVIEPNLRGRSPASAGVRTRPNPALRSPEARLDEAVGLARAIDLNVVSSGIVPLGDIRPATFIGKGKVEEIAGVVKSDAAGIVVMDCALSP